MDGKKILILGGYGNTGRPLAQLLLQETEAELLIAGRNSAKIEAAVKDLDAQFTSHCIGGCRVGASNPDSLPGLFRY